MTLARACNKNIHIWLISAKKKAGLPLRKNIGRTKSKNMFLFTLSVSCCCSFQTSQIVYTSPHHFPLVLTLLVSMACHAFPVFQSLHNQHARVSIVMQNFRLNLYIFCVRCFLKLVFRVTSLLDLLFKNIFSRSKEGQKHK